MICNRCGYQSPDGINFCPNCGVPFNPQAFQYQQPPPSQFSQGNPYLNQEADKSQRLLFILGLTSFGTYFFWAMFTFLIRMGGYRYYDRLSFFVKPFSVLTYVVVVFLSFLFVKKSGYKITLLILFIFLTLLEIASVFLDRGFF